MSVYGTDETAIGIHGASEVAGNVYTGPTDPGIQSQVALLQNTSGVDEQAQITRMRGDIQQNIKTMTTDQAAALASSGNPALAGVARDMALQAVPPGETAQQHDKEVTQQQTQDNAQVQQALGGLLFGAAGAGALLGGAAAGGAKNVDPVTGQPIDPALVPVSQEAGLLADGRAERREEMQEARQDRAIARDFGFGAPPKGLPVNDNQQASSIGENLIGKEKVTDYKNFGNGTQHMDAMMQEANSQYVVAAMGKDRGLGQDRGSMSLG